MSRKQLDMFSMLVPTQVIRQVPGPDIPEHGLAYLSELVEVKEPLIFLNGANDHLRFVRTYSSSDPGQHWHGGKGCAVDYADAKTLLKSWGYYRHSKHTYAEKLGDCGYNITADVWRMDPVARRKIDKERREQKDNQGVSPSDESDTEGQHGEDRGSTGLV